MSEEKPKCSLCGEALSDKEHAEQPKQCDPSEYLCDKCVNELQELKKDGDL